MKYFKIYLGKIFFTLFLTIFKISNVSDNIGSKILSILK